MRQYSNQCQSCDSDRPNWVPINDRFMRCEDCGVYRNNMNLLEDRPIPRDIASEINAKEVKSCVEKYSRILTDIEKHHKIHHHGYHPYYPLDERSLYDVACGCGALVWYARLRGWKTGGCDINLSHQRNAKEFFGVDIDIGFEDLPKEVSCFVFHHGIEHVDSPKEAVQRALNNMYFEGIIYFQHPVMPVEAGGEITCTGHQYEWTWDAFENFIKRFPVEVLFANRGTWDGSSGVPTQTWIVRKK